MGRFNILSKTDQALAAYIISEGYGTEDNTFSGKRAADVPNPPYIVCFSTSAKSDPQGSPVYRVKAQIDVVTNCAPDKGEDTEEMKTDSDDLVDQVFGAFHLADDDGNGGHALASAITSAGSGAGVSELTVQDVIVMEMEQGFSGKEGHWIDTLNLELVVSPYTES